MISRVLTLTESKFKEEPVVAIEPDEHGPYPAGLHTLSSVGNRTLVDGKRLVFIKDPFKRALGNVTSRNLVKIKRLLVRRQMLPSMK